jgi:thiamine-monophosphate kinase
MNVEDIGEFDLIERLRTSLRADDSALVVGVGDDAAVWRVADGFAIATTDTMVAGVHFLPDVCAWEDVGWKSLAVNVSDIAAMGGIPRFALVTLMLPPATPVSVVDALYAGLEACAQDYGVTIAGGDIVSAPTLAVTVALTGETTSASDGSMLALRRDAAVPGDLIAVTAPLGASAGGLRVLTEMKQRGERAPRSSDGTVESAPSDPRAELVEAHVHPWPRVDAGQIAVKAGVRCGMDISDGLVQDLGHICRASGVDAELRLADVPVAEPLLRLFPDDARMLAATGGEDYELLLVGGEGALRLADTALRRELGLPGPEVHIVGVIVGEGDGHVRTTDASGNEVTIAEGGWDHLRR